MLLIQIKYALIFSSSRTFRDVQELVVAILQVLIHKMRRHPEFDVILTCSSQNPICCVGIVLSKPALGAPVEALLPLSTN